MTTQAEGSAVAPVTTYQVLVVTRAPGDQGAVQQYATAEGSAADALAFVQGEASGATLAGVTVAAAEVAPDPTAAPSAGSRGTRSGGATASGRRAPALGDS